MPITITRIGADLPEGFGALEEEARAEGFAFVARLRERWRGDAYDADEAACVLAANFDGELAAVGAQTYDEYDPAPEHRRIRHFYVAPRYRRRRVGRALADALTEEAFRLAPRLHLRATHDLSRTFWDAMGFVRVAREDRTHVKVRP
jgi:ribosomal protein S18 acetylase RimI-like enzyme